LFVIQHANRLLSHLPVTLFPTAQVMLSRYTNTP